MGGVVILMKDKPTKEELLEDLKRATKKFDGALSQREYVDKGKYPINQFRKKFDGWNKAKKEAGLRICKKDNVYSDKELLEDLRRVGDKVEGRMSKLEYKKHGKYSSECMVRRFGSWKEAKVKAGVRTSDTDLMWQIFEMIVKNPLISLSDIYRETPHPSYEKKKKELIRELREIRLVRKLSTPHGNGHRRYCATFKGNKFYFNGDGINKLEEVNS